MTNIKRLRAFRRRWNIQWDDVTELTRFKNRALANTTLYSGDITLIFGKSIADSAFS